MHIKSAIAGGLMLLSAMLPLQSAKADTAGTMRYNNSANKMEFFNGTQWYFVSVGLPVGACTQPGSMDYNTLLSAFQFCNGTNWTQILGSLTLSVCGTPGMMDFRNSTYMYCNGLLWLDMKGAVATS